MDNFLGFLFKTLIVFSFFWYLGINFFKHSHEINSWFKKRRLEKLAEEHQDKVVDMREVFKKEFGFLETAEYLKERVEEIKENLSDPESEYVYLNALEFIFLVDQLHRQVLKTDKGVYIVSKKNIK